MRCSQSFLELLAVVLLISSPVSLIADETPGDHPADPRAKILPMPNDPGAFAAYLDPKLRAEGPDAIERSDFEEAKKVSSQTPAPASPNPPAGQENSRRPSAHEGHTGQRPGGSSRDRGAK